MELCVVSMELWARHMGRHCVVDKIVTFWGAEFPFFSVSTCHACYDSGEATAGFHPSWEPLEKQFTVSVSSVPGQQQQYLTATNPKHHLHNNRSVTVHLSG